MRQKHFSLVTGCPRSGTTAVGELLSLNADAFYLYEPMNYASGDRCIPHYFAVPGSESFPEPVARDFLDRLQSLDLDLRTGEWAHERGLARIRKKLVGGRSRVSHLICRYNPCIRSIVWKDPLAFFAVPFVLENSDIPVVITERPIGGLAASFKRFGWGFDMARLLRGLADPRLPVTMLDGLDLDNSVVNAAVLWNIVNVKTEDYAADPRVMTVDIENLIDDPVAIVRSLYRHCGLDFTAKTEKQVVKRYSRTDGADVPASGKAHDRNRNLLAVKTYWRKHLTTTELDRLSEICERFSHVTMRNLADVV